MLPSGKTFQQQYGPRGVLNCRANSDGTQIIENTGPLTKTRMETIDEETVSAAKSFVQRQAKEGKPFFCWWNATRMHFRTHLKKEHEGLSGPTGNTYHDGMVEHDMHVGELLDHLDALGLAENTIVFIRQTTVRTSIHGPMVRQHLSEVKKIVIGKPIEYLHLFDGPSIFLLV